ncbi:MAG: PIG-L deacetylase family protein, partial [Gammaproteobacteria bacterium]
LLFFLSLKVGAVEDPFARAQRFDDYVERGARILVVGAHPDDESLAGPLLAYACIQKGNDCHIAIFTRGGGGTCGLFLFLQSCEPDLAAVRIREMQRAAERYGVGLDVGDFSNQAPKISHDKGKREAIRAGWEQEGDPIGWLRDIIVKFDPDLLITLDPEHGFTGNAEHQLASRLVNEVLNPKKGRAPNPKSPVVFHVINRYTVVKPLLGNDPALPTEQWSFGHQCGTESCARVAMTIAREHRSQLAVSALALFALFADRFDGLYLRKLRPVVPERGH